MARQPLFNIRLDPEVRAEWEASAALVGENLSEYVRAAVELRRRGAATVEASAGAVEPVAALAASAPTLGSPVAARRQGGAGARRDRCPRENTHRPGSFCKACGRTPE